MAFSKRHQEAPAWSWYSTWGPAHNDDAWPTEEHWRSSSSASDCWWSDKAQGHWLSYDSHSAWHDDRGSGDHQKVLSSSDTSHSTAFPTESARQIDSVNGITESPWNIQDIGTEKSKLLRSGWVAETTLHGKLAGILPSYRNRSRYLQHPLVIDWGQDGASTSAGTSPIDSADTEGPEHPTAHATAAAGSWVRLFAEATPSAAASRSGRSQHSDDAQDAGATAKTPQRLPTPHTCQSRIPRPCKFMQMCRDIDRCSYCHDEAAHSRTPNQGMRSHSSSGYTGLPAADKVPTAAASASGAARPAYSRTGRSPGKTQDHVALTLRPEGLTFEGHVCQSRIPRPCRFMQRCREPGQCDFCHDHEAHSGKRTAKSLIRELHRVCPDAPARDHVNLAEAAAPVRTSGRNSHHDLPDNEYVGKFFTQLLNSEV